MPQVPIYTAQGGGPNQRTPTYIPSGGLEQSQQNVARQLEKTGSNLATISGTIQQQQDENETISMGSSYEAGIKGIHLELSRDSEVIQNPNLYLQKFQDKSKELVFGINDSATNGRTKNYFSNYVDRKYPIDLIEAQGIAQKHQVAFVQTGITNDLDKLSDLAATGSNVARESAVKIGTELVNSAFEKGFYKDAVEKDKVIRAFRATVNEKNMSHLAATDPTMLRSNDRNGVYNEVNADLRLKMLKRAEDNIYTKETRLAKDTEEVRVAMDRQAESAAINGTLTDEFLTDAENDHNPYIKPGRAAELRKVRDNAPSTEGNQQLAAIREAYHMTIPRNFKSILETQKALKNLSDTLQRKNPNIDKLANELQSDWDAIRNANNAETAAQIRYGRDSLNAQRPAMIPMRLPTRIEENQRKIEDAELEKWIHDNPGKDPNIKVQEILKGRQIQQDNKTPQQKAVEELRKGR